MSTTHGQQSPSRTRRAICTPFCPATAPEPQTALLLAGALSEGPDTFYQHWGITQPTGTRLHHLNKLPRSTCPCTDTESSAFAGAVPARCENRTALGVPRSPNLRLTRPVSNQQPLHSCSAYFMGNNMEFSAATLWLWEVTANFNYIIRPVPSTSNSTSCKRAMKSFSDALSGFISFHVLSTINRKQAK